MKTIIKLALAVVFLVAAITTTAHAQEYPKAAGYVNDFANLLTYEQRASLNDELAAFEKETTIEIAVVTVPQLNNESIEDYTKGIAEEWGVGKREKNNGVVFLTAPKERKMRIETASGARDILTDIRADKIRDNTILPRFKAGNMAQGVIDGTHAIMQSLDVRSAPLVAERETQSVRSEWTTDDMKVLHGSIIGVFLLGLLMVPLFGHLKARKYAMGYKRMLPIEFVNADSIGISSDIKGETLKKLTELKDEFSSVDRLIATSKLVNWKEIHVKLHIIYYDLREIVQKMKSEIAFAEKARKEGPELLKKIPSILKAAEKKLAKGKSSSKAVKHLEQARMQYAQMQSQYPMMPMIDWVIPYMMLMNIQSSTASAESAHQRANTSHHNDHYSSSSSSSGDSSSSSVSGDSFSGGGGFDSGGGSSGSW